MPDDTSVLGNLEPGRREFYRRTLAMLNEANLPYLVGGAFALLEHAGIERDTKDFDIFVRRVDVDRTLDLLARSGCVTGVTFPHWLAKAHCGEDFFDVIFCSGNGLCAVDDEWFAHAVPSEILGVPVRLVPAEEVIWQKAYIMERERFDGADIQHILRARAETLDWERLLRRFEGAPQVLLVHLTMFSYVYPSEADRLPAWVLDILVDRWRGPASAGGGPKLCRGTVISRAQYRVDVESWGYEDVRHEAENPMTPEQVERWTAAIDEEDARSGDAQKT